MFAPRVIFPVFGFLMGMCGGATVVAERPINLVDFAQVVEFTGDSPQTYGTRRLVRGGDGWPAWRGPDGRFMIGVEWDEPRDLAEVNIEFRHAIAEREKISVQYWRSGVPTEEADGAAESSDCFHGEWVTARTDWYAGDRDVTFEFLPEEDNGRQNGSPRFFHRTCRLRFILGERDLPAVRYLRAYGPCPAAVADLEIRLERDSPLRLPLEAQAVNGGLLDKQGREQDEEVVFDAEPMVLRVRYADGDMVTATRTIVTVREKDGCKGGFSFVPAEVVERGIVRVPSLGAVVTHRGSLKDLQAGYRPGASLFDRIASEPTPSWSPARRAVPPLDVRCSPDSPLIVPLGPPLARQEIGVGHDGRILLDRSSLKVRAADSDRWNRPSSSWCLRLQVGIKAGTPGVIPEYKTELLEGYLPVVSTSWRDQGLACTQTAVATYLDNEPAEPRGDETVVVLSRLTVHNPNDELMGGVICWYTEPAEALVLNGGEVKARGAFRDGRLEQYPLPSYRFHVRHDPAERVEVVDDPTAGSLLLWRFALEGHQETALELVVPFVPPIDDRQRERLGVINFDETVRAEADRWRQIVSQAGRFEMPDQMLNDFYKAQLVHTLITADRDPYERTWQLPAATLGEKVGIRRAYAPIRALEMRGLHAMAAKFLDAFVRGQSSMALEGRFSDRRGVFHGLPSEHEDYQGFFDNQDHGCTLWMLNEHYRYTRDRDWLRRHAEVLVQACDFITRQRRVEDVDDPAEKDESRDTELLPPGRVEGRTDWARWYAVNAWAWRGMKATAENLAEIKHSDAKRIAADARAFGDVLRASCRESMIHAPVVRLSDGTYIPFQPARSRSRGRDNIGLDGIMTGPLSLLECGLYSYHSPEAEWILRDLEDNVLVGLSDRSALDPGRMSLVPAYLHRGQYKHALWSFYNDLAARIFEETRMLAGLVTQAGCGKGPWYALFAEAELVYALRCLLVLEHDDELWLLAGVPDDWLEPGRKIDMERAATWFGPLDMRVESLSEPRRVVIDLNAPIRNKPTKIRLCLHRPLSSVSLNGHLISTYDASSGAIELSGDVGPAKIVAYW